MNSSSRLLKTATAAMAVLAATSASAGLLTVDPDGKVININISTAYTGVTLAAYASNSINSVHATNTPGFASTGPDDRQFGWFDGNGFNDFWINATFGATLTGSLASAVSIQQFADNGKFVLTAFDSNGAALGSVDSETDSDGELNFSVGGNQIKSITVSFVPKQGATAFDAASLDLLVFTITEQSVPEPATAGLLLAAAAAAGLRRRRNGR